MKIYDDRDKYQATIDLCADQWWYYDRDCLDDWTKECDKTYEHWDDVFEKSYKLGVQELKKIHNELKVSTRNLQLVPPPEECHRSQTVLDKADQQGCLKSWMWAFVIFGNLKPLEISISDSNIICSS